MPPFFNLENRVALITGASRGLGKNFALTLAKAGANLAITSRHIDALQTTIDALKPYNINVLPIELEVCDLNSINKAADKIASHFGNIDILVNNAGCNVRKLAFDITPENWDTVLNTNLKGTFFLSQKIAQFMKQKAYGRIINIASVTSKFGYAGLSPYCASRGGVKQLTMSLADEWGQYGITVNCLAPGWFKTDQNKVLYQNQEWLSYLRDRIPLNREGSPQDLDGPIIFLASEESRYITGQTLYVDGGITTGATKAIL